MPNIFSSFFMGGFECSTHRRPDHVRVDVINATQHHIHTAEDYNLLRSAGVFTVRDGLRWHLIEAVPGVYDWSSFLPMLEASLATGTQVIWDLCHWGVPPHVDLFSPEFITRFAAFARAAAELVQSRSDAVPFYCPINEISFWAWIGGDLSAFHPHAAGRGPELKRQLAAAAVAAMRAVLSVDPRARFVHAEPVINIVADRSRSEEAQEAAGHTESQYEAWDLMRQNAQSPSMGGHSAPDIIGVNYYWNNQWIHEGERVPLGHPQHLPLHRMLLALWNRYSRPILITETGTEAASGVGWLGYICAEVREAQRLGVDVVGICVYPVMDYPGWDDNRHCSCGLIQVSEDWTQRSLRPDLTAELTVQRSFFEQTRGATADERLDLCAATSV